MRTRLGSVWLSYYDLICSFPDFNNAPGDPSCSKIRPLQASERIALPSR